MRSKGRRSRGIRRGDPVCPTGRMRVVDGSGRTVLLCFLLGFIALCTTSLPHDGPLYDSTAYTECEDEPERPLYNGGLLRGHPPRVVNLGPQNPAFLLHNLTIATKYCFSGWVRIQGLGTGSALIRASLKTEQQEDHCVGTVWAVRGCWSFLKGGFTLSSPSDNSALFFESSSGNAVKIVVSSMSLQPFTDEQWRGNQQRVIDKVRKRNVMIHVTNGRGDMLQGLQINVRQVSREFPFGSAIAQTILGNDPYQEWFVERFNAAVFENELKWYVTEPVQGKTNYTLSDQMLQFVRRIGIIARGHNIFWEDPKFTPAWVQNLTGPSLWLAVESRIQSLMSRYREEFVHWDVSNELLHFDFYEKRLGPNASFGFFKTVHQSDPLATLFLNDFNVVEMCGDVNSTVDQYIMRLRELRRGGAKMDGIGLEGHFTVPNIPLMRAVMDKLGTLGLPMWLTEVDISSTVDDATQGVYLDQVLREGFSHPSIGGIMLWTALHPNGCYQMCLTDNQFCNLPAGDAVDRLLKEWTTGAVAGRSDVHGSFSFDGFLGEYSVTVRYGNVTTNSTFGLSQGVETKHITISL